MAETPGQPDQKAQIETVSKAISDAREQLEKNIERARIIAVLEAQPLPVPAIVRVRVRNFKSIEGCDVELRPLTLLVGHNGAGKSNFVDVLHFTADALRMSLGHAIRERGGISEVRRRSRGHPTHFGIRLDLNLGVDWTAWYGFEIAAKKGESFIVQHEECQIIYRSALHTHFTVTKGVLKSSSDATQLPSEIEPDRLMLSLASALPVFRRVYQMLSSLGFYNLNLDQIRELQNSDPGDLLLRDGRNLGAVIRRLQERQRGTANRIGEYLQAAVPGVKSVAARTIGPKETIEFRQEVAGDENPWRYLAANVSDGTLRTLGVLVAVFQVGPRAGIALVAIEEPEIAIHPGAATRLMDALLEASRTRQLLITTHSPDLLDHPEIDIDSVLVVEAHAGKSVIAPVDPSMLRAVREHLYTVGELLRLEHVFPDLSFAHERQAQLRLFGWDKE